MGSSTHLPGVGLRTSLIGRRTLAEILEGNRQRTADTRWAQMVRSIGNGLHLVKDFCNDQQYIVGSAQGSLSYRPGQVVALMSSTGTPGEVIVAQPPPGRAGASAFPVALSTRSTRFVVTGPPPAPIGGHSYLGLYLEEHPEVAGIWRIRAWRYADGAFLSEVQVSQYQITLGAVGDARNWQRIHTLGDVVVCSTDDPSASSLAAYYYWSTAETTIRGTSTDGSFALTQGDAVWPGAGSFIYFHGSSPSLIQLHRLTFAQLTSGSTFGHGDSWIGANSLTDAPLFPAPSALLATGADFQVPTQDDATEAIACPYSDGTIWNSGRGRVLVNPDEPAAGSCGWPVTGTRTARLTHFATGEQTVGLLGVGPASPELALIPAAWGLSDATGISVAPGGAQLALYPARLPEDGAEPSNRLLRLNALSIAYPDEPNVGRLTIQPGPNGQLPHVMLCRD